MSTYSGYALGRPQARRRQARYGMGGGVAAPSTDFVTTWATTGSAETITLPLVSSATYNFVVDWGDGSATDTVTVWNSTTSGQSRVHEYADAGTYTVTITGLCEKFRFSGVGDRLKIQTVENFGDIGITDFQGSFNGCWYVRFNATDAPKLNGTTSMYQMLYNCRAMDDPINHWDTSTIEDFRSLFYECRVFNQPLNNWDTSSATGTMRLMFFNAELFNQDITGWDVSGVTSFQDMFSAADAFDQDISGWASGAVTTMTSMFNSADSFDQDLGSLNITGLTSTGMPNFLNGATMSTANWSNTLIAWYEGLVDNVAPLGNISTHGGYSKHNSDGADAITDLTNAGWTVVDGGLE